MRSSLVSAIHFWQIPSILHHNVGNGVHFDQMLWQKDSLGKRLIGSKNWWIFHRTNKEV